MRKAGQDDWCWSYSGQQSWWRAAIYCGSRLLNGPRVINCDVRELKRKRFSRGKMRHLLGKPVRVKSGALFGIDRSYNYTGCRRMVVPF